MGSLESGLRDTVRVQDIYEGGPLGSTLEEEAGKRIQGRLKPNAAPMTASLT